MIDTLRLRIPLTHTQFKRVHEVAQNSDREQLGFFSPKTGEVRLKRVDGLLKTDQNSFHREIRWEVSPHWCAPAGGQMSAWGKLPEIHKTFLTVELSLPKLWYGHNIHLLYNFKDALTYLKTLLEKQFKLTRCKLLDPNDWQVSRVDCCYAWRLPNQETARQVLESLKHLHFPRKKPHIHDTSITFVGATYTVKFYLKLPEFRAHDMKALVKEKASLDWVAHLESKATGVLRYEATLRPKYLKRAEIQTVGDLVDPEVSLEWDEESDYEGFYSHFAMIAILDYQHEVLGLDPSADLENGRKYEAPSGRTIELEGKQIYEHLGGGFTYICKGIPTAILQYFLTKFLGDQPMREVDQVKLKLMEVYKPVKASRLVGFWLYIQRFGSEEAKQNYGRDSYYEAKADLKKAGVGFVEAPAHVTRVDKDFIQAFKLAIPSDYVTNRVDDFRDSDNLLNLIRVSLNAFKRRSETNES